MWGNRFKHQILFIHTKGYGSWIDIRLHNSNPLVNRGNIWHSTVIQNGLKPKVHHYSYLITDHQWPVIASKFYSYLRKYLRKLRLPPMMYSWFYMSAVLRSEISHNIIYTTDIAMQMSATSNCYLIGTIHEMQYYSG